MTAPNTAGTYAGWHDTLIGRAWCCYQAALAAARRAGDRAGQPRALMLLSLMQAMTEDARGATASATQALRLYRGLGDRGRAGSRPHHARFPASGHRRLPR